MGWGGSLSGKVAHWIGAPATDENGLFDARGHDLTLIMMIDRRDGLPLSRGERVWGRILFCGDGKLGCMVEGDYTATPSVLRTSPPNATMKIWGADS
jgi:hypothetical protein